MKIGSIYRKISINYIHNPTIFILLGLTLSILISVFYLNSVKNTVAQVFELNLGSNLSKADLAEIIITARVISTIDEVIQIEVKSDEKMIFQHNKDSFLKFIQSKFEIQHPYNKQARIWVGIVPSKLILMVSFINLFLWTFISFQIKKMAYIEGVKAETGFSDITRRFAHDIRKPLDQLMLLLSDKNPQLPKEVSELIDYSKELTDDLLRSRLGDIKENFNPIQLIQSSLSIQQHHMGQTKILEFDNRIDGYITIWGSPVTFKRAIINFIQNAKEELLEHPSPNIKISTFIDSELFKIAIHDNGSGFPKELLSSQGKLGRSFKSRGIGLGLKSSIEGLEAMDSLVVLSNESGAKIEITFKRFSLRQEKLDKKTKIILIDDDKYTALDWKNEAQKTGIEMVHFYKFSNLMNDLEKYSTDDYFFIDSYLSDGKGEMLAKDLYNLNFKHIYLTTSFFPEDVSSYPWLSGVIDKSFPGSLIRKKSDIQG